MNLCAQPDVQAWIDELAEKCNEGELNPDERAECRTMVDAADLIEHPIGP